MKRSLLILCFFVGISLSGFSQQGLRNNGAEKPGSRIEALKIAFLTRKLSLSTEEAQRFWPVYNQYIAEVSDVSNDQKQNKSSELETEEKILKIRKKFNAEFTKALNADKANAFFVAEKDFGNVVQKVLMERREEKKKRLQ